MFQKQLEQNEGRKKIGFVIKPLFIASRLCAKMSSNDKIVNLLEELSKLEAKAQGDANYMFKVRSLKAAASAIRLADFEIVGSKCLVASKRSQAWAKVLGPIFKLSRTLALFLAWKSYVSGSRQLVSSNPFLN